MLNYGSELVQEPDAIGRMQQCDYSMVIPRRTQNIQHLIIIHSNCHFEAMLRNLYVQQKKTDFSCTFEMTQLKAEGNRKRRDPESIMLINEYAGNIYYVGFSEWRPFLTHAQKHSSR